MTDETVVTPAAESGPDVDPRVEWRKRAQLVKGANYPLPDAAAGVKKAYLDKLWGENEAAALMRYQQATKNICYLNGRQRISWSKRTKSWEDLPLVTDATTPPTFNYLQPICRARTQRMLGGPVQFGVKPESNALEASDRAQVAKRFFSGRWAQTGMRDKQATGLWLAYTCGLTALKSIWNPDIGPIVHASMQEPQVGEDGQVVLDETGQPSIREIFVDENGQPVESKEEAYQYRAGDTDTALRTLFNLRLNPEAQGWTSAEGLRWLIDREVVPVSVAREKFPQCAEHIHASPGAQQGLTYERMAAASVVQRVVSTGAVPNSQGSAKQDDQTTVLQEYWELPTSLFPGGRLIQMAGEYCVYDGDFPDGVFPYTPLFDETAPLSPWGRPSLNDMLPLIDLINRQWASIDAEFQSAGVGEFVTWDVPGIVQQLTEEGRKVMRVPMRPALMNRSINDVFRRIEPPNVGGDRWRIIEMALRALFDIAMYHEVTRGQVPPGVDSGVAIEKLIEQETGQLAKAMRAQEASIISWARNQLAIARSRYNDDVERWIPVDRPDMGYLVEAVSGEDLPDPETITVELENFRPYHESAQRAELMELFQAQVIGPRQLLKGLDMGTGYSAVADSQSRHYARARLLQLKIERGEFQIQPHPLEEAGFGLQVLTAEGHPFVLADDDDHAIHMEVLDEVILDETQPWEVREVAMLVKSERRAILTLAAQQQAQPAPAA